MGIEVGTALLIGGLLSAGAAGASAHQSHVAQIHAGQESRDQKTAQAKLQSDATTQNDQNQLTQANVAARQRQRALASSYGGPGPGVATNPLGDVGQAQTRQSALLGG
jgi:hypothetical protein